MKKIWISMAVALFMSSSAMLTSCGGNNGDMPPESLEGNTQETGVPDADVPFETVEEDTAGNVGAATPAGQ